MNSWHTPVSFIGGCLIGLGISECIFRIGWWTLATLPLWAILFILVIFGPYRIDEWRAFKRFKQNDPTH